MRDIAHCFIRTLYTIQDASKQLCEFLDVRAGDADLLLILLDITNRARESEGEYSDSDSL